jgi:hypothetical protein
MAIIQMSQTGTLSVLGLVDFELTGVRVIKLCLFEYVKGYSSKVVALFQQSIGDIFLWLHVIENGHPPLRGSTTRRYRYLYLLIGFLSSLHRVNRQNRKNRGLAAYGFR